MEIKIDFVVKLGGSAVTKKSENETANLDNIKIAAKTLFESWKNGKKFIIVHGAGYKHTGINLASSKKYLLYILPFFIKSKLCDAL